MALFSKKHTEEKEEDFSTLSLPFAINDESVKPPVGEPAPAVTVPKKEASASVPSDKKPTELPVYPGGVSPLDALKRKMNLPATESSAETPVVAAAPEKVVEPKAETPEQKAEEAEPSSLLKRCMPYIYDEQGVSQVDTKPDYVLESVDDIIRAAEERAKERIAERYRFTDEQGRTRPVTVEKLDASAAPEPMRTEEPQEAPKSAEPAKKPESAVVVTSGSIIFDDFSGKRTVVTENDTITTPYSDISSSLPKATSDTIPVPPLKTRSETMEDIVSHTKPVNISDAPALKPQKTVSVGVVSEEILPDVDDDYRSPDDTRRIGMKLKKQRRSAFFRLVLSVFTLIASAIFTLALPDSLFSSSPFVPSLVQFGLLVILCLSNIGIFSSFKTAFTKQADAAAPIALLSAVMLSYMVIGLISGSYSADPVLLAVISFTAFNYFGYKRADDLLNNFRIVASKSEKKAVALIDDQKTATSMARSAIDGEVLAAGVKRTAVVTDFLKYSYADRAFSGRLGTVVTVFSVIALVAGLIIGVSYRSFDAALCAVAVILSFLAMPTYSFAEFAPLSRLSKKLYSLGAMITGKYFASKIEQSNAVVVTSAELFPEGTIELFNMKPLGANNIDRTLNSAAAIATAIGSPLASIFKSFISEGEPLPTADTIKYEDNLGISGWVGDSHFFVGNRTLMEAHGIKVPPLEVDRKILHRGYFPIYVAEGNRACALLIVKYLPSRKVRRDLVKLVNAGLTLLIDNCDANITAPMLSEYYGLYEDSIKIMDHKGVHNYKTAVNYSETFSTGAAFIGKPAGFFAIISGALKLKTASNIMYALHIVLAALASAIFILASLDGRITLMQISVCALIEIISLFAAAVTHLISK